MPTDNKAYELITQKIDSLRTTYPSLRGKPADYIFSALCIKANLFKNPAVILYEEDFSDFIVDGQYDGGVDILLSDPNSDNSDLVIAQSKYYTSISSEDVSNAMSKMATFYKEMISGHYEQVSTKVQGRFLSLYSELSEDAKINFVLYTSAPQSGINRKRIEKRFREQFTDSSRFEVTIYFGNDIEEEIRESESRRPSVEIGKIAIDVAGNYLQYGDEAIIVNASAFSIKTLYAQHSINLLSKNLRYHIKAKDIDRSIRDTIQNSPETFWFKNNGITIICDDFKVDGKEVKLHNFSIINGGQTTYLLHASPYITERFDLFLPCKIVRASGETDDQKNMFSLEIAKATNSQKPIKAADLRANAPEQILFSQTMREEGLYYQTKRGEKVPPAYREKYQNASLVEIGKLCLTAIFQMPCSGRNKPSTMYLPQFYNPIFSGRQVEQKQIAKLCKELLYIDYYFRAKFQKQYDRDNASMPDANIRLPFAHNSRTLCIAFVAFASRYYQRNFTNQDLIKIFSAQSSDSAVAEAAYDIFSNLGGIQYLLPPAVFQQKDVYEGILDRLFNTIIDAGIMSFTMALRYESSLTASNYLKNDRKYYDILSIQ